MGCPGGARHHLCDFPGLQFPSCKELHSASAVSVFPVNTGTFAPFIKTIS